MGQFDVYSSGVPVIRYFRSGNTLADADTIIHEFIHYVEWTLRGRPVGASFDQFIALTNTFENSTDAYAKITSLILNLAQ